MITDNIDMNRYELKKRSVFLRKLYQNIIPLRKTPGECGKNEDVTCPQANKAIHKRCNREKLVINHSFMQAKNHNPVDG